MSDRYYAGIRIGSSLPREHLDRICALLETDGDDEETLLQRVEGGCLHHEDSQAAGGEFGELEEACRELGLAYVRESDGCWEILPQVAFWRPGMAEPQAVIADNDGNPLAPMEALAEARELLRTGRAAEALALLEKTTVDVPELPPFQIAVPEAADQRGPSE